MFLPSTCGLLRVARSFGVTRLELAAPVWGGSSRLAGIRVHHDFEWLAMFGHDRATFPRGKSLADLVARDCPPGKRPALLLTDQLNAAPSIIETDDEYVVVVPIVDYLNNTGADAASTYYARLSSRPLTQLPSLS